MAKGYLNPVTDAARIRYHRRRLTLSQFGGTMQTHCTKSRIAALARGCAPLVAATVLACQPVQEPNIGTTGQTILTPPADDSFTAFNCGGSPAADAVDGFATRLDIVGDSTHPALYRASDATNLYLRVRLNASPSNGGKLAGDAWAFLFDTDDDLTSFEYGIYLDGAGNDSATWEQNPDQSPANSANDTTRTVVQTYAPTDDYWAVTDAVDGSAFDGDADFFLTFAIPLSDLSDAGIDPGTATAIWAATGSAYDSFDADLACDDGSGLLDAAATDAGNLGCEVDTDGDGQCDPDDPCPLDNPDDPDMDGECGITPECTPDDPDTDGDGICDLVDNCPDAENPEQTDNDGDGQGNACDICIDDAENDADGDTVCGNVDNCPNTANLDQEDTDEDGIGDVCETCPDADGDFVCNDDDNCVNVENPTQEDQDGDGFGDACDEDEDGDGYADDLNFTGGGCHAGPAGHGHGELGLVLLFGALLVLSMFRRRRRRHKSVTNTIVALALVVGGAGVANAQNEVTQTFPTERFRLTTTDNGLFNVEWGKVPGHLAWNVAAWVGGTDDTFVVRDANDDRLASIIDTRVGGAVTASLAVLERVAIGVAMPLIFYQDGEVTDGVRMGSALSSSGVGDLQLGVKAALLPAENPFGFALRAQLGVPTANSDTDYFGDDGVTFAPEAALSRVIGPVRAAFNVGLLFREKNGGGDLQVDDELYFRLGAGYRPMPKLEVAATLSQNTSLKDPFQRDNRGVLEALGGATYNITGEVALFAAGGAAIEGGVGGSDWRALAGARLGSGSSADKDGDRVSDFDDQCPLLAEDRDGFQDKDGCPDLDNDADGVPDESDGAPNDAEDLDAFEDTDGVPDPDNDGDGFNDDSDRCPNEAETVNGFEDDDGCPDQSDVDGDGLMGDADQCPNEAEDLDGFDDADGCPDFDNDGDGLADIADGCPATKGPAENRGCPDFDLDADGVVDRLDNCPDENGKLNNFGCKSKQLVEIKPGKLVLTQKLVFARGKAQLRGRSNRILRNVAAVLKAHPELDQIEVGGHTDSSGDEAANLALSQARAEAVVAMLVKRGVAASRLTAKGYGETMPIGDNSVKAGRAANNRIELVIVPKPLPAPAPTPAATAPTRAPQTDKALSTQLRGSNAAALAAPRTTTSGSAAAGTLSPDDVVARYQQNRMALERCYAKALKGDPQLATKRANVTITVDKGGSATAAAPGIRDSTLRSCVENTIRAWSFDKKPADVMHTQITVVFRQQ